MGRTRTTSWSAIRAIPNRQSGFSANFLMFGREGTQPIDLTFGLLTINTQEKETFDFVQDLITALNFIRDVASAGFTYRIVKLKPRASISRGPRSRRFNISILLLDFHTYAVIANCVSTESFSSFPYTVALHFRILQNFNHLLIIFAFIEIA